MYLIYADVLLECVGESPYIMITIIILILCTYINMHITNNIPKIYSCNRVFANIAFVRNYYKHFITFYLHIYYNYYT